MRTSFQNLSAAAALAAALCAACGHTIIDKPVDRQGDNWQLTLRRLVDGPNRYERGTVTEVPTSDMRFIWVHLTLHNDQPVARRFNFNRCDLDAGDMVYVPAIIDADAFVNATVSREPELDAGETITRRLIYAYPRHKSPTRLVCAPMTIPLPQF